MIQAIKIVVRLLDILVLLTKLKTRREVRPRIFAASSAGASSINDGIDG